MGGPVDAATSMAPALTSTSDSASEALAAAGAFFSWTTTAPALAARAHDPVNRFVMLTTSTATPIMVGERKTTNAERNPRGMNSRILEARSGRIAAPSFLKVCARRAPRSPSGSTRM